MQDRISNYIKQALGLEKLPAVEIPTAGGHGHYSTNVAMQMAKGASRAPLELANELVDKLVEADSDKMFSKIETAGPGFINFWLSKEFLLKEFEKLAKAGELVGSNIGKRERVIIDYSQPNIAKRMHVGHLRSTIIGDALANIYDYLGYRTVRWNYYGDWGTQFGKLIAAYKMWGSEEDVKNAPIETLLNLYVRFHNEMRSDPTLEDAGRSEFKKLEEGDRENRWLWKWFKQESLVEFERIYKRLGIKFDVEFGEAYYEGQLGRLLRELGKKGFLTKSDGAVVIDLGEGTPPALMQKSDGATLYMTRDVASLAHRLKKYKPAKILYVVSNEQTFHFSQLFKVAERLGMNKAELVHVKFGLVLDEGKKLSTRSGGAVRLEELMNKSVEMAYKIVNEKNSDLAEEEKKRVAEMVGVGALKYNDLKENRNSDIVFNWDKMLDLRGDTAPYLQYTAVRLANIIRKAGGALRTTHYALLTEQIELDVIKKLLDFNDAVVTAVEQYMTGYLAKYLYELASLANQYYEKVRILEDGDEERKNARLVLVGQVIKTLEKGLGLLGIQVPERI